MFYETGKYAVVDCDPYEPIVVREFSKAVDALEFAEKPEGRHYPKNLAVVLVIKSVGEDVTEFVKGLYGTGG